LCFKLLFCFQYMRLLKRALIYLHWTIYARNCNSTICWYIICATKSIIKSIRSKYSTLLLLLLLYWRRMILFTNAFMYHTGAGCRLIPYHQSIAPDWVLLYPKLNNIPFVRLKLLRVAILKRKVTIFRANSCALETSKFDVCVKLTKKATTVLRAFISFYFFNSLLNCLPVMCFMLHEVSCGNILRLFGWTHCLYLCSPFLTLKVHQNPKGENRQIFRLSNLNV
jgi:hypothetical protein